MMTATVRSWKSSTLGEVAKLVGGGTPSRSVARYFGGDVDWVTPTDLRPIGEVGELGKVKDSLTAEGLKNSSAKLVPIGTVLFSSRASIGKLAVANRPCATNQGFVNFIPLEGVMDPWFLAYYLCHTTPEILHLAGETTYKEVSRGKLARFPISYPVIDEQRRIVIRIKECLNRVEEIRRLRKEAHQEAKALEASLLHKRFNELQQRHNCKVLGDIADIKGGSSLPAGTTCNDEPNSTLLVKVGDMNLPGNEIFISTSRECLHDMEVPRSCPVGTVVFPKRGGAISTNKKRLLAKPALLDPNLMGIIADESLISGKFLYYWFLTFNLSTLISGSTVPQLNRKDLSPLEIPCPPKEVQESIVGELDAVCDVAKALQNETSSMGAEVEYMSAAILRKAFAGEL